MHWRLVKRRDLRSFLRRLRLSKSNFILRRRQNEVERVLFEVEKDEDEDDDESMCLCRATTTTRSMAKWTIATC